MASKKSGGAVATKKKPLAMKARMKPATKSAVATKSRPKVVAAARVNLKDPPRAVLDLDAVGMSPELVRLPALVTPSDPYIARIRFGRQPQDVLRLVIDLREDVKTELFALEPVASFGHRVVLDLYPLTPIDPLMALLRESPDPTPPAPSAPSAPGSTTERPIDNPPVPSAKAAMSTTFACPACKPILSRLFWPPARRPWSCSSPAAPTT